MKKAIRKRCEEIEQEEEFTILFAVESGSRLWGITSKDSDYDIRLVFYYPMKNYLSLRQPALTYQWISEDRQLDITGFDIYKYCKLLLQSNPNMIDWTLSDIIYYGNKTKISPLIRFIKQRFNPFTLYNYYFGIAHNAWQDYKSNHSSIKRLLYCIRGVLGAQWILEKETLPPYRLIALITALKLKQPLKQEIQKILMIKKQGLEKAKLKQPLPEIKNYIKEKMVTRDQKLSQITPRKPTEKDYKLFDEVIMDIITKC